MARGHSVTRGFGTGGGLAADVSKLPTRGFTPGPFTVGEQRKARLKKLHRDAGARVYGFLMEARAKEIRARTEKIANISDGLRNLWNRKK